MADVSGSDMAIGGGAFAASWAGLKWLAEFLTNRTDKRDADRDARAKQRAAELDAREAKLDAQEAAKVTALEGRLEALEKKQEQQGEELERYRRVIDILVAKVAREDPNAPELRQVASLLGPLWPIHLHAPPDMADLIDKLNKID
ncbi:hypothetical protein M9978_08390 [Sphingomonas sp. MG17]|uniref:Uncharacterized protein n=1 Tax=Sphingomonas tagetis TaxID=2949092 RepID=A0A9X2HKP1_9SPHN|nr:hypothetical protein [Sphingomonas tagetis]MCP3730446.1 hypothetical protein [Sphingomonas tagetis]